MRSTLPHLLLLLIAGLAPTAHAQDAKPLATVNNIAVPQARMDAMLKARAAQGQPDTPEIRQALREELINREILSQEAQKKSLDKNPEVLAQLELFRQTVLINAYREDFLKTHPIDDEALKKEYERIKASQGNAKEYQVRHILVDKEDEAKGLIARIKKGESFDKLAGEKSKDAGSKTKGGSLGWSLPNTFVKPFAEAMEKLKKGQMTEEPVRSQFGWHIIRLDNERPFQFPALDQVKSQLLAGMQQQQWERAILDLKAKAKVE